MRPSTPVPLVEVTRGRIVESVHYGSLAINQPDGRCLLSIGDGESPFFMRSSAKPFQALAFLERGGAEFYRLDDREVALICASHSGTPEHLETLEKLQEKIGIREDDLRCGAHAPYHTESANRLLLAGEQPHTNHNNCSGKHTSMLAFSKMIGAPLEDYLEPVHPVQQAILATFAEMCGVRTDEIELGVDGCTAPVFGLPLEKAAAGYARLCQPDNLPEKRAHACRLITRSMPAHAFMVAGPGRFDTDAMEAGNGAFISKAGAEGYLGLGSMPGKSSAGASALGMAIKISDGDLTHRATDVIALTILSRLGILDAHQMEALSAYGRRPVRNWRGKEIGEIRPTRELLDGLAGLPG
jgi:L-asparaginase II